MLTFPTFQPHFAQSDWSLPRVLEQQAELHGDRPFLQWTDAQPALSFSEVNRAANRLAHGLAARGVAKGEKVAIFLPNSLEYILLWFAINKLGAAEVTIGDAFKGEFLVHQVVTSGARLMVTTPGLARQIAGLEHRLPQLHRLVLLADAAEGDAAAPTFARIITEPFAELINSLDDNLAINIDPRDLAAVLFTSGTTGPAKAVMMPHSQIYFTAEEAAQVLRLGESDVVMTAFPFFHANAQLLSIYAAMIVGIRCVLYRKFSASGWIDRVRRSGATVTNCLGATMAFIAAQTERADDSKHALRAIYNAPTTPALARLFADRFGVQCIVEGYGQTEISIPFLAPMGFERPAGACGVLVGQWFEVKLIDPQTDEEAAEGGVGELLVRHKAPGIISDGFLGMPEKTLEAWRDLWFHTGDAMRRDNEGWYYFVDRLKDTLRRRGENISSFEVEAALRRHPSVTECAVVAVPATDGGGEDEVLACIVPAPDCVVDCVALIAWCADQMPRFAIPRYVRLLAALPQTPSEKVKKAELRAAGVTADTWDSEAARDLPHVQRAN